MFLVWAKEARVKAEKALTLCLSNPFSLVMRKERMKRSRGVSNYLDLALLYAQQAFSR